MQLCNVYSLLNRDTANYYFFLFLFALSLVLQYTMESLLEKYLFQQD